MQDSTLSRIGKEAGAFLSAAGKIQRPANGEVAEFMDHFPPNATKGLNGCLRALAEAIGKYQDIAMETANKELLTRLSELCEQTVRDQAGHSKDGYNPTDALLAVAYPAGEEGAGQVEIQTLRDAFQHHRRPIFSEIMQIMTNIAVNKKLETEGHAGDMGKTIRPTKPIGWLESVQDDRPAISDKQIQQSAAEFDKDKPPVSDDDIKKSAAGDKGFNLTPDHLSEYEQRENRLDRDIDHLISLESERSEIRAYYQLAKQLEKTFDETLGTCLYPAGMTRDKA